MDVVETRREKPRRTIAVYFALGVLLLVNLFPVYWMFVGSPKQRGEFYASPGFRPEQA
ncbi:MAG: hypothetical protein NUW23_11195 [Firmicutes bacterium]|jgi:ABC-type glycerol-3-phosphate transport system permease component|nr:hypothetical protein [Bacillota bacterium]